ncbi:MAG: ComEA family DNA-binding protein [Desulfomonilia bacterium]|jgi:competence protein ComEA|uniref:Helix-hairpin-helix DNA-binding motif class 1 domain-containing protein n=1 Tax=anaerobic digester metagenome TaxID=1263854 RepID=A0A485M2N3_9ZZZZ|nr:helix-hairpin-helix domain-containing protein [Pseudomonadota bacterium]HON37943.1 helix-hairpin-helix domain-containing protein [Deltaproteobacteria bacterium]HRS56875.1 helix-hairpin-helix domain-containing protein [Desulfomonilia bacterium]HPD22073.1 helix-hairpin-helix domain-containing protein [Deltaproteobacteria bacterium]HPX18884.1 helix-hairpin-helix domain-containing protein [Deltaproteobacteria bacterium]
MKTYSWLAVGIITLMLAISGITYAQAQGAQPMQEGAQQQTQQGAMDLVNVNTASEQELQQVPGMDQSLAQSIVQYRQTNGPFDSVNDLTKVQGIDDQKLQGMRGYLTAEKLNINTAKAEELQNIPGMDQTLAQSIIKYRETNGPFGSVDELKQVQGMDDQKLQSIQDYITVEKININTASVEEMQVIPGMDQTLVQSIIQYRETNGPFGSVDELKQVEGIDDKKLQSIQEYVTAEKIDLNTASVEELLIIPGVDQSLAQNIVEYRQANGPFGSVDDLSQVSGITEENMSTIRDHVTVKEEGGGLF